MKLWGWTLAIALAATGFATQPAAAQPHRVRVVEKTTYYESNRKWRGSDRKRSVGRRKWNNGHHRWGWRTACRNQWRNGRRERVCRNVRYRRW